METFEARLSLPCSPETAFEFLIQPSNIKLISPPAMGLFFVEAPERLSLGAKMHFKLQAYGVARESIHEVTQFQSAQRFVEQQVSGPLRKWVHEHVFEVSDSGVTLIDRIQFEPPGGVVGLIITAARIQENLEDGFDHRHSVLEKMLRG